MRNLLRITLVIGSMLLLTQCSKRNCGCVSPPVPANLTYGDSIFYLRSADYTIAPLGGKTGTYTAFPDNLQIDKTTGKITISLKGKDGESQTGMWYRINYRGKNNEADSTLILISGLSYIDKFYRLSQNDSIVYPIYNGDPANAIPPGDYDLTSDNKFAINAVNGQINLKECMRRGFFSTGNGMNSSWKIASIKYAVNDESNSITNQIDIVLYYYRTVDDVPSNVSALMQAHRQMTVGLRSLPDIPFTSGAVDNNIPGNLSLLKPRPPCVIIVGN